MNEPLALRVACPDADSAAGIANSVVAEGLAASANLFAPVNSVYRWNGSVHAATEVVVEMKTHTRHLEALCAVIRAGHPYEVPAITWWPIAADAATRAWIAEATAPG